MIILATFSILTPVEMMFNHTLIFKGKQYWRLLTTFFYFGPLNVSSLFELHWVYVTSSTIESQYFFHRAKDYSLMLLTGAVLLVVARCYKVVDIPFLSMMMETVLVYLLSRLLPDQRIIVFFVQEIPMRLLPLIFCLMTLFSYGMHMFKIYFTSLMVGHILWYLLEVFPRISGIGLFQVEHWFERENRVNLNDVNEDDLVEER
ncbi:Derlin-2/3 [Angomonas deanei]|nr:Derlin-2/3 [Angomonas deanei]|eukprot:EPY40704.1 Derlin-2/3 [Angomonas deanei]